MAPLAIFGLLAFMIIDLIRMMRGKPSVDEEWQHTYVDSNMNYGQGPLKEDKTNDTYSN